MIIGVLGPSGTYSDKAASLWIEKECNSISRDVSLKYCGDFIDTFDSIVNNEADIGIVPVENSIEGSVGVTLDLLMEHEVQIIGEVIVPIEHCLLSKGKIGDIRVILSHPQALGQCRQFIKSHFPHAEIRTTGSTSHAAKLATEFEEMAAIASRESASKYRLNVLLCNIQDCNNNHTRFIVFRKKHEADDLVWKNIDANTTEQADKTKLSLPHRTSIIVYLDRDRPGALYDLLGEFATRKINLTRIESRPSKRILGDYLFYIDFAGNISDTIIKDALNNILPKAGMMKVLGSYVMM
ncbi:prephenate dehydratase [uncultured Methanomethylovorans sp.]|uniref:prephenate dehydratase n=1 Tax=uncultured Methanomethylovorans sp. TaxID=183759 RepID=UPI002AA78BC7|nr:prephenate dehydratase [uncultured Methanomethylovorans sp.]